MCVCGVRECVRECGVCVRVSECVGVLVCE